MKIKLLHKLLDLATYIYEELEDQYTDDKNLGREFFKYMKSKLFEDINQKVKVSDFIYEKILDINTEEFDKKYNANLAACKKTKNQILFVTQIVTQMLRFSNSSIIDW